jgi:glycosyltransferase involved in cell wall biosynthesis
MPAPLVSVLVPTCDGEGFIGAALESVFAQTLDDLEVVVVDDCSFDDARLRIEPQRERLGIPTTGTGR